MATIKEVAKKASVSVGTVSNVLSGAVPVSEELKNRVLEVIRQLDYHPNHVARSLKSRQTRTIGMIVSAITNPFIPQLVRGAEDEAWRQGYLLITFNTDDQPERERQMLAALRGRQVDGVLLAAEISDREQITSLSDSGMPIVCLAREFPGLNLDCVVADNFGGARECVRNLVSLGHRSIGLLNGTPGTGAAAEVYRGYREALAEANLAPRAGLVLRGGFHAADGYHLGLKLLKSKPRATAVLTANSMLAIGFLRALKELNLVCPDHVALATFDDPIFAAALRPALTAVAQPSYELGSRAMEVLLKRIEEPGRQRTKIVLPTRLMIRESSGMRRK